MNHLLKTGLNYSLTKKFSNEDTAKELNIGNIPFVSTPSLILLMEQTCHELISSYADPEYASINAEINIKHTIPVKINEIITSKIHLKFIDGNTLFFDFAMINEQDEAVAIGAHERMIIKINDYIDNHA